MTLTDAERERYDRQLSKFKLAPVDGSWLHEHFLEYLWWEERKVPVDCRHEYVYELLRRLEKA